MSRQPEPPLGHLRGMYYDYEKKRYFPLNARSPAPGTPPSGNGNGHGHGRLNSNSNSNSNSQSHSAGAQAAGRGAKRKENGTERGDMNDSEVVARRVKRAFGRSRKPDIALRAEHFLSNSSLRRMTRFCDCQGEVVTSIQSIGNGATCMTTDHGKVVAESGSDILYYSVCSQKLLGIHCNVMRGTWLTVSNGIEPHIHSWRYDLSNSDSHITELEAHNLPNRDVFAMSSFDGITTLAASKALYTVTLSESAICSSRRKMASDALAVHQTSRDIVYAGLRNSTVVVDDFRTPGDARVIPSLPAGKAVVGVQRLSDSAVPWGLAVSGMLNQLVLFDIRFPKQPLLELRGHVNNYQSELGLTTTPDGTVLLAGGTDRRLRAWSTLTGERLRPAAGLPRSLLGMTYPYKVQHIAVADDLSVRVAAAGDIFHIMASDSQPGMGAKWVDED